MKLYLNETSPFSRLVLVTALEFYKYNMDLVWVDPWGEDRLLLEVTPFSMVPVLMTADGAAISESLLICQLLAGEAAALLDHMSLERFGFAKTLMEIAFRRVIFSRFLGGEGGGALSVRTDVALQRSLNRLDDLLVRSGAGWSSFPRLPDIALVVALDYVRFRLIDLYEDYTGPRAKKLLMDFLDRPSLQRTTPGRLVARPRKISDFNI